MYVNMYIYIYIYTYIQWAPDTLGEFPDSFHRAHTCPTET